MMLQNTAFKTTSPSTTGCYADVVNKIIIFNLALNHNMVDGKQDFSLLK